MLNLNVNLYIYFIINIVIISSKEKKIDKTVNDPKVVP